jgi:23S rRNA (uridine2552-2'-O)-methyltransferase
LKKNKSSKNWLNKKKRDYYFRESKAQGYRSRSAFKLVEMDKKFKFFKKNMFILDLGSFPGGWSQVASKKIKNGKILAVDIKKMEKIEKVDFINGDFTENRIKENIIKYFNRNQPDLILSDMAANTSGNKNLDSYRTGDLCIKAMQLAKKLLTKEGIFISKLFMGSSFGEINEMSKNCFQKVIKYKPKSSKKESKEIYIYCKGILKI